MSAINDMNNMKRFFTGNWENTKGLEKFTGKVKALKRELVEDRFNKLETGDLKLPGLEQLTNNTDMDSLRSKLNNSIVEDGIGALVAINGTIVSLSGVVYRKQGQKLKFLEGTLDTYYCYENIDYPTWVRFGQDKRGNMVYNKFIKIKKGKNETEKSLFKKKIPTIPGWVFLNNYKQQSEIDFFDVNGLLTKLHEYDLQEMSEFRRSRTIPFVLGYNSDATAKDVAGKLDKGESHLTDKSHMSALGGTGITVSPANPAAVQSVTAAANTVADLIRQHIGLRRDSSGTSTNKTILEIIDKDTYVFDHIIKLHRRRFADYKMFYNIICAMNEIEPEEITYTLSKIMQIKLDLLDTQVLEAEMKRNNVLSQIEASKGEKDVEE